MHLGPHARRTACAAHHYPSLHSHRKGPTASRGSGDALPSKAFGEMPSISRGVVGGVGRPHGTLGVEGMEQHLLLIEASRTDRTCSRNPRDRRVTLGTGIPGSDVRRSLRLSHFAP